MVDRMIRLKGADHNSRRNFLSHCITCHAGDADGLLRSRNMLFTTLGLMCSAGTGEVFAGVTGLGTCMFNRGLASNLDEEKPPVSELESFRALALSLSLTRCLEFKVTRFLSTCASP